MKKQTYKIGMFNSFGVSQMPYEATSFEEAIKEIEELNRIAYSHPLFKHQLSKPNGGCVFYDLGTEKGRTTYELLRKYVSGFKEVA